MRLTRSVLSRALGYNFEGDIPGADDRCHLTIDPEWDATPTAVLKSVARLFEPGPTPICPRFVEVFEQPRPVVNQFWAAVFTRPGSVVDLGWVGVFSRPASVVSKPWSDLFRKTRHKADRLPSCFACGTVLGGKQRRFCSEDCSSKHHKKSRAGWIRAAKAGATRVRFHPYSVFYRDDWHCQMCGVATPRHLRGTYEDNAPELDHITPLSKGGAHHPDNCQCLCRRCNGIKGDSVEESTLQATPAPPYALQRPVDPATRASATSP